MKAKLFYKENFPRALKKKLVQKHLSRILLVLDDKHVNAKTKVFSDIAFITVLPKDKMIDRIEVSANGNVSYCDITGAIILVGKTRTIREINSDMLKLGLI